MAPCTLHAQAQAASTLCCRMDAAKAAQFSMRGATPQEEQALLKHAQALVEEPEEEQESAAHAGRKHAQQGPASKGAGKAAGNRKGTKQQEGAQRRTAKKQAPPAFANGAALPDPQGVTSGLGASRWQQPSANQEATAASSFDAGLLDLQVCPVLACHTGQDQTNHPGNHPARAQQPVQCMTTCFS